KRRLLVVGGGVSGMEAACTAARNGNEVTLVEQSSRLGGAVRWAA
ncbi:MAG: FAD-dependent oxidoreductase, partial [Actinobacteria bacterium]|nr:FAD-dependent oxidoreductase [Actinomycetota bacterium]